MTFMYELDPYSLEIYGMCENEPPTSRLSKVIVFKACECMHLVRRGHFPSRDKDGGHTIGSATAKNPMLHVNTICYRTFI